MCNWHNTIRDLGIVHFDGSKLELEWSASGIEFETSDQEIRIQLEAVYELEIHKPFLGVFVNNGCETKFHKIEVDKGIHTYTLLKNDKQERVVVSVVKLTEKQYNRLFVTNLMGNTKPTAEKNRKMLFIGDSITAGYGIDGINGISVFNTPEQDVCKTHGYLLKEYFDADAQIVAYSGNGIVSHWISEEIDTALDTDLMPAIFPYGHTFNPNIIVMNLGTNDASYTRCIKQRERDYVNAYCDFVKQLQKEYPNTPILLGYGVMEETLRSCVKEVASICDTYYLPIPLQDERDGLGACGHPTPITQRKMFELYKKKIQEIMDWE